MSQHLTWLCVLWVSFAAVHLAQAEENTTQPVREARGCWISTEAEPRNGSDALVKRLKEHGFNMVLAYYWPWDKDRIHRPPDQPAYELDLKEFTAKAKAAGIEVHFWIFRPIPKQLPPKEQWCPEWNIEQQKLVGKNYCMSDEKYLSDCEEATRKLVQDYDFDGLHMDEVSWNNPFDRCLDQTCRQRFEKETGIKIENFPDDLIQVKKITTANQGDPSQWKGKYFDQWSEWKCTLVTDYLRRMADAARSVRKLDISYALKSEEGMNKVFYGEDTAEIAKLMDFIVPMTYFTEYRPYQHHPELTGQWAGRIAQEVKRGNPKCQLYAAVSTFGNNYNRYVEAIFNSAVAAGKITEEQKQRHLYTGSPWDVRMSMEWLKGQNAVPTKEWEETQQTMEAGLCTADEVISAIESVRAEGLPGVVFFPYHSMWTNDSNGVVGTAQLSAYLKQRWAEPVGLPHRSGE